MADHVLQALFGKAADADQPLRAQCLDDLGQVGIAMLLDGALFGRGQLHRRAVLARFFQKDQRAVIDDDGLRKEVLGRAPAPGDPAPEPAAAHLGAGTAEAVDQALGVLAGRCGDRHLDAHPVAHRRHLAKGHAGLHHAEGAGVHPQEHDPLGRLAKARQIGRMPGPGIVERVVDMRHRWREVQRVQRVTQPGCGVQQTLGGGGGERGLGAVHGHGQNKACSDAVTGGTITPCDRGRPAQRIGRKIRRTGCRWWLRPLPMRAWPGFR